MSLITDVRGLFASFRGNPLDNPATPLSAPAAWVFELFGGAPTSAGVAVNEFTAMQLATVYTCVNVLASDISTLPLKVYERTATGKQPAPDSDLYYLLGVEPNPEMTAPTFFSTWVGCAILTGNGYAEIQRRGKTPVALWPRHPRFVRPLRAKGTEIFDGGLKPFVNDLIYELTDTVPTRFVAAKDMLHLTGLSMDGLIGLSPIQAARQTIGTAIAAERFGAGFFGRGSRPSGLLTGPSEGRDDVKLAQARASWEAANSGDNQGRTAVLRGDWKWTAIGISPGEAQFLETQQYTRTQIAALFRLQPHMVGDSARDSNSNRESAAREYVDFSLRNWLVRVEAEIHRKLMPTIGRTAGRYSVRFDISELIRGDFASQMNGFAIGKQWGFYNTNDIKRKLGENPIGPEGDVYYVPLNMVPMGQEDDPEDPAEDDDPTDPNDPGEADDPVDPLPGKTKKKPKGNGGRNQVRLLERMADAYGGLFRDAHGRLLKRSKRDAEAVQQVFGPVLEAIAAEARRQAAATFRVSPEADLGAEKILRDCRKALEKRAAEWTEASAEADAAADLQRAVRAVTLGIFREAGSAIALGE